MKIFVLKICLFALLLPLPVNLYAFNTDAENNKTLFIKQYGDLIIKKIEIRGLKRTDPDLVLDASGVRPGNNLSQFKADDFIDSMRSKNIFESVTVDYIKINGDVQINIMTREKITLVPIPIVKTSSDNTMFGLFVLDTNLFGLQKNAYGVLTYTPDVGWKVMAGYIDNAVLNSPLVFKTTIQYGNMIIKNVDVYNDTLEEFSLTSVRYNYAFGYAFTGSFTPSIIGKYYFTSVQDDNDNYNEPESLQAYNQGIQLHYKDRYFKNNFYYGINIITELTRTLPLFPGEEQFTQSTLKADYSVPVFDKHKYYIYTHAGAGDVPVTAEDRIGGLRGFTTLPYDQVSADYYASVSSGYEMPIYTTNWGIFTALAYLEYGQLRKDNHQAQSFYGPGCGFRLYLKKVAIPAVGLDFAYNGESSELQTSFSIGAMFN